MELTAEQSQMLGCHPEKLHEMIDPITKRRYVLVAADEFAQLQADADDARHERGWNKAVQRGMAAALGEVP